MVIYSLDKVSILFGKMGFIEKGFFGVGFISYFVDGVSVVFGSLVFFMDGEVIVIVIGNKFWGIDLILFVCFFCVVFRSFKDVS